MKPSYQKLKTFTLRAPVRNVIILYNADLGVWGVYELGKDNLLTSHKRRRECYRTLRKLGYYQVTRSLWATLSDKKTNARVALSAGESYQIEPLALPE